MDFEAIVENTEARRVISRDDVFKAVDSQCEWADMSKWWGNGYGLWIHSMTGRQRGKFEAAMGLSKGKDQQKNWQTFRARLIVACAKDMEDAAKAQPVFREQDVDALNEKHAGALDHLAKICQRVSGFGQADVDEMTKNSPDDQTDDS
jgi:hypothetical protein